MRMGANVQYAGRKTPSKLGVGKCHKLARHTATNVHLVEHGVIVSMRKFEAWMNVYETLSLVFDLYISLLLTAEYFFGRSDMDMRNEVKRKRKLREKYRFETLTNG